MYIATFGHKVFMVSASKTMTFNDLQFSTSLETEKQDNPGKKPSTYIKNVGLGSFSIKIQLEESLGVPPLNQIEEWFKIMSEGKPYPFLLKGKPLLNTKWLLIDVSVGAKVIDNKGNILSAEVSLKFDEFASQGKKTTTSTTAKSSKKKKDTTSVYEALKPKAKAELKTTHLTQEQAMKLVRG